MNTLLPPLRQASFRKWLNNHGDGAGVGRSVSPSSCPIARWLYGSMPRIGHVRVTRDEIHVSVYGESICRRTPLWANKFIGTIDEYTFPKAVTKEMALDVLDRVNNT